MSPVRPAHHPKDDAIRVLLCEPHHEHGYAVADAMARSPDVFHIMHADGLDDAMRQLEEGEVDIAMLDLGLLRPQLEATLLRVVSLSPATSIVVICDESQQDAAMACVRHGAHDFVVRHSNSDGMVRTVRSAFGRHNSNTNLHFLAHHDALTGLANRVLFTRCLDGELRTAAERHSLVGVLFVDLDDFKPVNDRYGHDAGDEVLRTIGRRLREGVPRSHVVARMGGDEFAVLVVDPEREGAIADTARKVVELVSAPIQLHEGYIVSVSCSVGVASSRGRTSSGRLVKDADEAMYRAKRVGGGGIQVSPGPTPTVIDGELEGALERREFELYYQPQVDGQGALFGVEALLRWNRNGEVMGPNTFIPQLEESGHIVGVGAWVLHTALHQLRTWWNAGLQVPRIAVNVSPLQLSRPDFSDRVAALLDNLNLPANALELEVTERVVLSMDGPSRTNLETLRELGVLIALDDFGTGYSSLAYLHRFPVDTLKVDRSFVQDIGTNPRSCSIVGSILDLGHRLGIVTVAEGVESQLQADILLREGCDVLQGFLYGHPRPGTHLPSSPAGLATC